VPPPPPPPPRCSPRAPLPRPQVCHGADLPAWWHPDSTPTPGYGNYTAEEDALSRSMQWYWANFAATGNPGSGDPRAPTAPWPAYDAKTRATLSFEVPSAGGVAVVNGWRAPLCHVWDTKIGYNVY
jgi:carboxylesterase type B